MSIQNTRTEYKSGREQGKNHAALSPAHQKENERKIESALKGQSLLVAAYWQGYRDGMNKI